MRTVRRIRNRGSWLDHSTKRSDTYAVLSKAVLLFLVAACLSSSSPRGSSSNGGIAIAPIAEPQQLAGYYRVTVVSASIADRRRDGTAWNTTRPSKTWMVIGTAAGLAVGQASLGTQIGELLDGEPTEFPPAPVVEINVGGMAYRTSALSPTLAPQWDETLLIDVRRQTRRDPVVINVLDGVDHKLIGTNAMTVGELVARDAVTLTGIPNVANLNLRIEPTILQQKHGVVWVPADAAYELEVRGGDILKITASGTACVEPGDCHGPDGAAPSLSGLGRIYGQRDNWPEFHRQPHGSLVGWISGVPVWIGFGGEFRVPRDGTLRLAINDTRVDNNSGGFWVEIVQN